MPRFWHKPGVLMTAYLLLFAAAQSWAASRSPASSPDQLIPDMGSPLIALALAIATARGSALGRGLIISFTAALVGGLLDSRDMKSGGFVSVGLLAICLVQIALAVSSPIYERTRKDWDGQQSWSRLWPTPPRWMAATALAGGVVITLLFLGSENFQSVPCAPPSASPARCMALAQGFPVHFLGAIPAGSEAYPLIYKGAAAEDIAIWTALSFAACYLIWLPSRRPIKTAPASVTAPV